MSRSQGYLAVIKSEVMRNDVLKKVHMVLYWSALVTFYPTRYSNPTFIVSGLLKQGSFQDCSFCLVESLILVPYSLNVIDKEQCLEIRD